MVPIGLGLPRPNPLPQELGSLVFCELCGRRADGVPLLVHHFPAPADKSNSSREHTTARQTGATLTQDGVWFTFTK